VIEAATADFAAACSEGPGNSAGWNVLSAELHERQLTAAPVTWGYVVWGSFVDVASLSL
jgi:hypothetical protein